jgi:hypothetical protein
MASYLRSMLPLAAAVAAVSLLSITSPGFGSRYCSRR